MAAQTIIALKYKISVNQSGNDNACVRLWSAPDHHNIAAAGTSATRPVIAPAEIGRCVGPGVLPCARMYCINEALLAMFTTALPPVRHRLSKVRRETFSTGAGTPGPPDADRDSSRTARPERCCRRLCSNRCSNPLDLASCTT